MPLVILIKVSLDKSVDSNSLHFYCQEETYNYVNLFHKEYKHLSYNFHRIMWWEIN
jgi:hypothetical protein